MIVGKSGEAGGWSGGSVSGVCQARVCARSQHPSSDLLTVPPPAHSRHNSMIYADE